VNDEKTLLLGETGVELLPDGSTAVNVGPIVRALRFLTDGRGEDRGVDEAGSPLPDLMSLAFDVIEAIILGGKKADYFRQVKRDLEAEGSAVRSSLKLAKQAQRVYAPAPATTLDHAAEQLRALIGELGSVALEADAARELALSLEAFQAFGVERWVSATAQLLVAVTRFGPVGGGPAAEPPIPVPERKPRRMKRKARPPAKPQPAPPERLAKRAPRPAPAAKRAPRAAPAAKRAARVAPAAKRATPKKKKVVKRRR
jgi:hypothetical protein